MMTGDYSPKIGRFTCPDPLGDTGGDHDVYDYCVDDPVSLVDPAGLSPARFIPTAEKLARRYAPKAEKYVRTYLDKSGEAIRQGAQATANAADRLSRGIVNTSARIGQGMIDGAVEAGKALVEGGQRLHIASQAEGKVGQTLRGIEKGAQIVDGALTPFTGIAPGSTAGKISATAKGIYDNRERLEELGRDIASAVVEGAGRVQQAQKDREKVKKEIRNKYNVDL